MATLRPEQQLSIAQVVVNSGQCNHTDHIPGAPCPTAAMGQGSEGPMEASGRFCPPPPDTPVLCHHDNRWHSGLSGFSFQLV